MPIIVISARAEDQDKIDALDAGADDYLTKPFSVQELLARIRVTERRLSAMQSANKSESVFVNGNLKIDYAAGCAYLSDEELHLTPIEYKLLCLLSRNVGKVLTHTFITQKYGVRHGKAILHLCVYLWLLYAKNRTVCRFAAIYSNSRRYWLQNGKSIEYTTCLSKVSGTSLVHL